MENLGKLLNENKVYKILEILLVFGVAGLVIWLFLGPKEQMIRNQLVVWVANILMLLTIFIGARLRGESWDHFGLDIKETDFRELLKSFLWSLLVLVLAMTGFILGSIIMANITGIPEQADMSNYEFLKGNPGILILSLLGVYIASSFGEEVIYRGFLINRFTGLRLNGKWGRVITLLLSSLIFGFVHYSWGPMGIVQTFFMGLALGICYLWLKKRLWILVFAHAVMDTVLLVQIYMVAN